jgi:hypothetical protein
MSAKFQKISLDVFETLAGSEDYMRTEIDGKAVIVAFAGPNRDVRALYYSEARFGSFSLDFRGCNFLAFSELDPFWPYGN